MDSAFILCFLLIGIRLTQALTPDEYISLRRHNHSFHRDATRPSSVQIFMHQPKTLKSKNPSQFDVINRRSERIQDPSPSEYYTQYDDDVPVVPQKQQEPKKQAFAFSKYDDYYPVRKPSSKTKSRHSSSAAKKPKRRPVQVFPENTEPTPKEQGKSSNGEGLYPRKNLHEEPEANKPINEESTSYHHNHNDERQDLREHQILSNKRQNYREETKSMSGSEQVQKLMSRSEEDKMFVAATGYGGKTREQFHEQGMEGPHSYRFGFNTGDTYNPMARYEERDDDGHVRGSYSFVDARGELQVVHYESHPKFGFRTKTSHGSHPY